ncbi:sodium/glutamate symporter [Clostridium tagluense]|uniref:sodium/glutamate symporter n=1 Tax=Clostridium tagluense TaxID=360422 RepID=UPI001CF53FAB|nr:sodium/glutamate symporter [Clostridium tagluense]MCB2314030.1 sodium/glutamate symporter [Clostridium tagluense]MCB2318884.1 sodium/glutamate symporter [Clostridium tagluense]MCB2323779.1 sodium/glutamate symporter [Clostridium tagluense]MCB2328588.1 sodium/glutamate symporter [Clostridium tagluense]MCB2333472.1 sodium/glutamate symporter [Clostridium tagluense]
MAFKLDMIQAVALAVVVLFIGQKIKNKLEVLDKYCIPAPVIGGLIFAIITLILKLSNILIFDMDITLQKVFMTAFFTTIGYTASLKLLKKGGKGVFIFLGISILLCVLQDFTGVALAKMFGLNPLIGLSTASVPMVGGHGTSGAFGPVFEKAGAVGATTVAMASATFGLIMGSIIGGPLGKRLIEKNNLSYPMKMINSHDYKEAAVIKENTEKQLNPDNFMGATSQIFLAMGIGTIISFLLEKTGRTFPPYIGAMFAAAILRNISDSTNLYKVYEDEIDIIGGVSLSLFLSMALMGLKLWQLADLALPLIVMLLAQTILMGCFAYFVTFNLMGRDYDAAVMASGNCGFGMGATPNAMANMGAMTAKYGHAPRAFFIVPLVGSLFIDFCNTGVITMFIDVFGK